MGYDAERYRDLTQWVEADGREASFVRPMSHFDISKALGVFADHVEFQVDETIVVVMLPAHGYRGTWLLVADRIFDAVWNARQEVIAAAIAALRSETPESAFHGGTGTGREPFLVFGIWIDPASGSADYDVGPNPLSAEAPSDPEAPGDYHVMVTRESNGALSAKIR